MTARSLVVLGVAVLVLLPLEVLAGEGGTLKRRGGTETQAMASKSQSARESGIDLLVRARTINDLTRLVGVAPKCESLAAESRLCSWNISNRQPGYGPLSAILKTKKRVYLMCDLPVDNSARSPESCTLSAPKHPLAENY